MLRSGTVTFAVRILIGALFIYAGTAKIGHFNEFAAEIAGFRILPAGTVGPLAVLLPFFEIGLGLYLVAGLLTSAAAIVGAVQLMLYAAADWPHAAVDLALAALCLVLSRRPPGIYALDNRLRNT